MSNQMENKAASFMDSLERGGSLFDLGHPLLNRITDSFTKAAGIGAIQAVSRDAYFSASGSKKSRFPDFRGSGETNRSSLEALVKSTGKESMQWGLVAGVHSGLIYGLKEARGTHDWKNNMVAGALTGVAMALTTSGGNTSHEQAVQCAITGAAISTAANILSGMF